MEGVSFEQHKTSRKKSSKKKTDNSSGASECANQSKTKYLNADIPGPSKTKYLNSDAPGPSWYDPLSANMSPMKCPAPFEGTSDIACSLSTELEERLSMNSIADNVNGLVNGASSECVSKNCSTNEDSSQQEGSSEKQEVDNNVPKIPDQPIENLPPIQYMQYESELQMPLIMKIIQKDLSEPYSIYTYRYFIHNWPKLCFLAMCEGECVGAIVCKLDIHRKVVCRGYIAMLAVDQKYRRRSIGSTLVKQAIYEMIAGGADEVVLETEVTNKPALRLYEALGFVRDKRLFRYYLNGVDALRLKLWFR